MMNTVQNGTEGNWSIPAELRRAASFSASPNSSMSERQQQIQIPI
jgi:hypothetical protein